MAEYIDRVEAMNIIAGGKNDKAYFGTTNKDWEVIDFLKDVPTADVIERSKIDNALADMQSMLEQEVLNDNVISDVGQGIEIAMGLLKENIGE